MWRIALQGAVGRNGSPVPGFRGVPDDQQVQVAVWTTITSGTATEQYDLVRIQRLHQAAHDFAQNRVVGSARVHAFIVPLSTRKW
jgi:hypothetical protein